MQSATVTFGQGLTVSALQLVRAYGVLEQSGVMVTPHFLVDVPNDAEMAAKSHAGPDKARDRRRCERVR